MSPWDRRLNRQHTWLGQRLLRGQEDCAKHVPKKTRRVRMRLAASDQLGKRVLAREGDRTQVSARQELFGGRKNDDTDWR
jgi:hypothetical protein